MEDFIIENSECEGHFGLFKARKEIWMYIKSVQLSKLCEKMQSKYLIIARMFDKKWVTNLHILVEVWSYTRLLQ